MVFQQLLLLFLCGYHPTANAFVASRIACHVVTQKIDYSTRMKKNPARLLFMVDNDDDNDASPPSNEKKKNNLPFFLDPGTKGGALFLSLLLFLLPLVVYNVVVTTFEVDEVQTGIVIGVGFTVLATLGWVSTYLFRVATKDMTYAKQLKDYESAVIAKRLEELDEDEVQALQEEVTRDDF